MKEKTALDNPRRFKVSLKACTGELKGQLLVILGMAPSPGQNAALIPGKVQGKLGTHPTRSHHLGNIFLIQFESLARLINLMNPRLWKTETKMQIQKKLSIIEHTWQESKGQGSFTKPARAMRKKHSLQNKEEQWEPFQSGTFKDYNNFVEIKLGSPVKKWKTSS